MSLSEKLKEINKKINAALAKSPYGPRSVTILGASKGQSLNDVRSAGELGVLDMGENYAQELLRKAPLCLDTGIRWHFMGKVQSNKIKHFLPYASSVQSVDSLEIAQRISRVREQMEKERPPIPILIQVNVGSERQKSGLPTQVVDDLFSEFLENRGIRVAGLMCLPPVHKDPEKSRPYFKTMKELFNRLKEKHPQPEIFNVLSMGMSNDYPIAVEEGSTCVRIGTALFGPRD